MVSDFDDTMTAKKTAFDSEAEDKQESRPITQKIGRYRIQQRIGKGAMGEVYLGWDPYIKRRLAIKTSRLTSIADREEFFTEAQSAGRLNHPNIITVYDVGEFEDICYIAMEFIKGKTLTHFCSRDNLLSTYKVTNTVIRLCEGLSYAHHQGVVHRDIKPSNIMLSLKGIPKIMDFGIALVIRNLKQTDVAGTPSYMAPEQIEGKTVNIASDIFSLGCVFYEMLSGEKAFRGSNFTEIMNTITNEHPVSILELRPELPVVFDKIINKALSKKVSQRYHSCLEFAQELHVALRAISGSVNKDKVGDTVQFLSHVAFFKDFNKEQLEHIISVCQIIKAPAGKLIVTEGDVDDTVYVILNGTVSVIGKNDEVITVLDTGEVFGEMAFLGNQIRNASILTDRDCVLLKANAATIEDLPESIRLLFFKNFAITLIRRFCT